MLYSPCRGKMDPPTQNLMWILKLIMPYVHQDTMKCLFLTMKKNINQTYNSKYIPVTDWMKSILSIILDVGT